MKNGKITKMINYLEFLKFELLYEYNYEKIEESERNLDNMSQKEFDDIFNLYNIDLEVVDKDSNLKNIIGECNIAVKERILKKVAIWRYKWQKCKATRRIRLLDIKKDLFSEKENELDTLIDNLDCMYFDI